MIVACPDCSTGYLLPEHLVGPGGARVRCPRCQRLFAVDAAGRPRAASATGPEPAPPEPPLEAVEQPAAPAAAAVPPGPEEPAAIARDVIAQLAAREGAAIVRAHAERRLFAEFGPALMEAYEAYRLRAGAGADPGAFREALRERWGVELVSLTGPGA